MLTYKFQFYMTWYLLVFSDTKKAAGYAWGLMGLTAKLAQSVSNLDNGLAYMLTLYHFRSVFVRIFSIDTPNSDWKNQIVIVSSPRSFQKKLRSDVPSFGS
jgi:hypothetical protein